MKKIIGLGGVTERFPTGRNVAQQELWVAAYRFEESAKAKWIDWISGFEELKKKIEELTKEISELQGELWTLRENREKILTLKQRMVEAFQFFIERSLTIGKGALTIARLVDPTIPTRTVEADLKKRISSAEFRWSLIEFVEKMTDATFQKISKAVKESQSTDLASDFWVFEQNRTYFASRKDELDTIEADIKAKDGEIQDAKVRKSTVEGTYNELKPLYDTLKQKEWSANLRTWASRTLAITLWGVATALALSTTGAPEKAPQISGGGQTVAWARNTAPSVGQPNAWHQVVLSGNLLQISPNTWGVNNAFPWKNGKYQVEINGDITTWASGTLTYRIGSSPKASMPITLKEGLNMLTTPTGERLSIVIVRSWNGASLSVLD